MRGIVKKPEERSVALLAIALFAFVVGYLYLLRNVGIANDEWTWLLYLVTPSRALSTFHAFTLPYNSQPIIGEIALYRAWANTVGVAHHWVLDLVFVAAHATTVALVFATASRRVGHWGALTAAVLVLVAGRAWETLLFPASFTFVLPALAACVAWNVLDCRANVASQIGVAALLALASVSGGLALAILGGLAGELAIARTWRRLWMVVAGIAPLVAWYAINSGYVQTHLGHNLPRVAWWVPRFLAASAGAAVGLPMGAGAAILVVALAGIFFWRRHAPAPPRLLGARSVGLLTTLALTAIGTGAVRAADTPPSESRYLYFPVVVMVLLACEWTAGLPVRRPRLAVAGLASLTLMATVLGVHQLRVGKEHYRQAADATAVRMGAMLKAGGPPIVVEPGGLSYTPAVLRAFVAHFGSAPLRQ